MNGGVFKHSIEIKHIFKFPKLKDKSKINRKILVKKWASI